MNLGLKNLLLTLCLFIAIIPQDFSWDVALGCCMLHEQAGRQRVFLETFPDEMAQRKSRKVI